jgi:uncharacterized membrane protein YccC
MPSWRDWLFSIKTFISAMLALYIAFAAGLPRPYWAMTAVYVVANPISEATVSKAFDRVLGTLLGAAGAVILVPLLVNAPELLMLAIALWAGAFLYIALHDRTPRNYPYLLAGYTLPLIVLPTVNAPETIFDVAVARSEEIIVGIIVAAVINTVLFPTSIGPLLKASISRWLDDASSWAQEILLSRETKPDTALVRQRLAADISPLTTLVSQLSGSAGSRDAKGHAQELKGRLLLLLPILSSIADRLHALRLELKELPPDLDEATKQIAAWLKTSPDPASDQIPDELRNSLRRLEPAIGDEALWPRLVRSSLIARLSELIDLWQDCLTLQDQIAQGAKAKNQRLMLRHRPIIGREQHYDRGLLLLSVGSTVMATFIAGLAWISSGWSNGANGVAFVAIACCFFGGLDRPAPFMRKMLIWSVVAYSLTGVYLFAILPRISDFELIVFMLAPPLLLAAAFTSRPELSLISLLLTTGLSGDLALQGRYSADFISYAESGIAIVAGIIFAEAWTLLTRPFGAEFAARRLIRAGWADLAELASGVRVLDHAALNSRTLDRLVQLVPRLASDKSSTLTFVDALAELRTGYNIITLQRNRRVLPVDARETLDSIFLGVAELFRKRFIDRERVSPPANLLNNDIDRTLWAVLSSARGQIRQTSLDALVGLRRSLFPLANGPVDSNSENSGSGAFDPLTITAE